MDECIRTYLSLCRTFPLATPWNGLPVDPWSFLGPSDPDAAFATWSRSGMRSHSCVGQVSLNVAPTVRSSCTVFSPRPMCRWWHCASPFAEV